MIQVGFMKIQERGYNAGFPQKDIDEFYTLGKETNAFIKSNYTNEDLVSYV